MAGDDGSGSIDSDRIIEVYRRYAGKIEVMPKVPVSSVGDFAIWYTPGVAEASIRINKDPDESFELTSRWNMVAIVTDATRVLGLGSLKPEAAYPVMEGKALIFKLFGGVDAVPIVHRRREPGAFASLVKDLEPSFGGVNLEDIESPKCFYLLDFLRMELEIPVWHDDQQGTAAASLAGLINAFKIVGKNLRESRIVLLGAGAANIALYRFLKAYGVNPRNIVVVDSRGVLHPEREDMDRLLFSNRYKYEIALETEGGGLRPGSGVEEALKGADALVAASRPGPGVVKKEWIRGMSRDPIVFALANPTPEIWPWEAREAGARVVATGRSDLPNQVNNALVFPGVFRGALDARSRAITDGMAIAAAEEIARYTEEELGLDEERILPPITDWQVHYRVAAAVAWAASREKVARKPRTYRQELENARAIVESSRRKYEALLSAGLIERLVYLLWRGCGGVYERGVHVRPPRPGDKGVLAELIYRFYMLNEEFDPLWTLRDDAREAAAEEAEKIVSGGNGDIVLVAEAGEEVVGFIRGYIREMPLLANGRVAVVKEIYVKPQARRIGLGTLLIERFSEEARKLGARAVAGEFPAQNAIAHRFYERLGFRSFMHTMIREV